MTSTLQTALEYLQAGISVLPIRLDGSKAPACRKWEQWQTRLMTVEEASRLFAHGEGVGIIGGKASGNLEILDFDKPGAYEEWLDSLDEAMAEVALSLPTIATPDDGVHVYLRSPVVERSTKLAMAVAPFPSKYVREDDGSPKLKQVIAETKGDGGYVVAPGSPPECHQSKRPYLHQSGPPIIFTPLVTIAQRELLLAAARALSEREVDDKRYEERPRNPDFNPERPGDDFNARAAWPEVLEPLGWKIERTRGDVTYWCRPGKSGGVSATTGRCGDRLYVFTTSVAYLDSDRTYDRFGVYARANHAGDFEAATRDLAGRGYGKQERSKANETSPPAPEPIEDLAERLGRIERSARSVVFERGSEVEIARDLIYRLRKHGGEVVSVHRELFQYDSKTGAWSALPRDRVLGVIQGYDGAWIEHQNAKGETSRKPLRLSKRSVDGVYGCALSNYDTLRPDFFRDAPAGVLLGNGFATVSADGIKLLPHAPENRARYPLPYDYDDTADVRPWRDFMDNLFRDDDDKEEKGQALQEFVGAALAGVATQYARCMVLTGSGANGKSTFIELVSRLFPSETITTVSPHAWGKEYNVSRLSGSMLNACNELPGGELLNSETFKAVVTGERVAARDPYQLPYEFVPRAAHLFACNTLPSTTDHTEGFWRRFLVVEFTRNFASEPDMKTKDQVVRELVPHLPAVLLWALHGAVRLIRRGGYTKPKSHTEAISRWRTESNSVLAWLEGDGLGPIVNGAPWMKASTAYARYRNWCDTNNMRAVSSVNFGRRLVDAGIKKISRKDANYYGIGGEVEH